jgi:hypothetical protein
MRHLVSINEQVATVAHSLARFDPRQGQRIFPLTSVSRPALMPTQPPVQWVPGGPFPGQSTAGA